MNLTDKQQLALNVLGNSTTGRVVYHALDDMNWITGEGHGGLFVEDVDFEPLCGQRTRGDWYIHPRTLKSLERLGLYDKDHLTPEGKALAQPLV